MFRRLLSILWVLLLLPLLLVAFGFTAIGAALMLFAQKSMPPEHSKSKPRWLN